MNILLFVFSVLLILSFTSHTLLQGRIDSQYEELSYSGYMLAERNAMNEIASGELAKRAKKEEKKKSREKETKPVEKEFVSKRVKKDVIDKEGAKFNLAPLMQKSKFGYYDAYYKIALRFLENLYGHASFLKDKDLSKILTEMIALGERTEDEESFAFFSDEESPFKEDIYHMLKGTQEYDLKNKVGYPPLEHYFTMNRAVKNKPLYFKHLSSTLLEAIFGAEITQEILHEEKKKWEKKASTYTLGIGELEALLNNQFPNQFDVKLISSLFGTKGNALKQTVRGEDASSKIRTSKSYTSYETPND